MKVPEFIVIYDTYCGWCYGAAPVFDALLNSGADVEVLHRQLFQGNQAHKMSEGKGDLVLAADARISALTGQPFSQRYIDHVVLSETEVLDSTFTAQAAALVHGLGAHKEFAVRHRLETARYIDGVSASDRQAVVASLVEEGISSTSAECIGTPALELKAAGNALRAKQLMETVGVTSIPAVLNIVEGGYQIVDHAAYYEAPDQIGHLAKQIKGQTHSSYSC